ncbi:MAG: DUF1552 domain-containing protein [Lentisphaeraceae bacterium]|nr:DUF1552 domain-containing protein [Lentisphaeraceae bacterium]
MINRRNFLRASGVAIALPFMPSMLSARDEKTNKKIRRMVCVHQCQGYEPENFFPKETGKNYKMPASLEPLTENKENFTVFSGLEHGVNGGHYAEHAFMTGIHIHDAKKYKEGNISVDIKASEHVGFATRFPSLHLALPGGVGRYDRTSWTRSGVSVPMNDKIDLVFNQLFMEESLAARKKSRQILEENSSVIDAVLGQSKEVARKLNKDDKEKMSEFLSSLRETEVKIQAQHKWVLSSKPKVDKLKAIPTNIKELFPLYYDLMVLALRTDSTRVVSLQLPVTNNVYSDLEGVEEGYHLISHHGKNKSKLAQLHTIEKYHFSIFNDFINKLKGIKDGEGTMLDSTIIMNGAGMGNGSSHSNRNLPVILAGGGLEHGGHRNMYSHEKVATPLCNLYLSMLQWFGMEIDTFNTSRKALTI